jgi:multisubunit Na+/H+ antiporter MnhC subunit
MTDDAFAAALVLTAIPVGMASGMFGVWLFRSLMAALFAH